MSNNKKKNGASASNKVSRMLSNKNDYAFAMSHAPSIDQSSSWLHMVPIAFFAAIIICVVVIHPYIRPMSQFFWTSDTDSTTLTEFFSYGKAICIIVATAISLLMVLFRFTTQSLAIKRTYAYIPMGLYALFTILSYIFSDYKEFAWMGWNDRFEGTLPILCYMIMLFMIINSINTENNIKQLLWPLGISSTLLSFLGISQAVDHDFFRTTIGQKLLCLDFRYFDGLWEEIDAAAAKNEYYMKFTFNNGEIYQTVYNINYVSFYLTLLVPLFCMLFIRALMPDAKEKLWKKICIGGLIALLVFNLIGSASSGGYLGIGVAVIIALIIFNKQLLKWWKPILIIFLILGIIMGCTVNRWWPELSGAIKGALKEDTPITEVTTDDDEDEDEDDKDTINPVSVKPYIDYMKTEKNTLEVSFNGNPMIVEFSLDSGNLGLKSIKDADGKEIELLTNNQGTFYPNDERFLKYACISIGKMDGYDYTIGALTLVDTSFYFTGAEQLQVKMLIPATGKTVSLDKVESFGFENKQGFGSGRGYIWSRSLPLLKKSIIIGSGADTYCAVFPQYDYAGKYNAYGAKQTLLIVDKPHNMYIHMGVGTGCVSLIAAIALYLIYIIQSLKLYFKRDFGTDYISYVGVGTFLGVTAFLVTGFVDDSTVSVMPLFYSMLGLGIACNMIIQRREGRKSSWRPWDRKEKKQIAESTAN